MAKTQNTEVESEDLSELSADNPLTDPKIDRLGYAPFAKHLADSICKMTFPEGFVIAVYGSWGSGKSTLLNFITYYLKQKPEEEQPIIIPFNPWLFSGSDDITRRFFDQIQSVLNQWKFVPRGLKDRIAGFAKVVSQIPLPYAQAGNAVATVFDDKQKDASDLKEEVEITLQQGHPRIVVTIDDIDRLDAEEIRKLFRVIKAFPNFTDVVYLLLFDKDIVVNALGEAQGIPGEAYLDKVVQVPFDLPLPDKTLLRRLLFEKLSAILIDTPKQLFNQTYWGDVYFQGIDHFISNPRDIVRLTNNLSVTYPAVKGEVNSVDFIAIEALRVFCPMMYDIIRKNPKAFAGQVDDAGPTEQLKSLQNSWIAQLQAQDREPLKRLLSRLFPKLEAIWGSTSTQQESLWRNQLRVCSSEIFPIYFRMALSEGELSDTDMKAILAMAGDAKAFGKNLIELANQKRLDGTTQVRTFLERLENYTEDIPKDCISSIVQAFFDVGDQLLRPEDESYGMFDFGNDIRIGRIIEQLTRHQDETARFEMFKEAMSNGNALSTIVREVATLGEQQGKYESPPSPEEERLISTPHLEELEELALKKVQEAAQQDSLLQTPGLAHILYCWQEWTSAEEVKQWVQKAISNQEGLVDFLEKFLEKSFSQSGSDAISKSGYSLDSKRLEPYLELSSIMDQLTSLTESSRLTEDQTTAIKQLIQEYDQE